MKKTLLLLLPIAILAFISISFHKHTTSAEKDQYIVLYYGATDCYYCNLPENIQNINLMIKNIGDKYPDIKKVMVCMDKNLQEGMKFIAKYDSSWTEISVGSFYQNELAYAYLNNTEIPGVPHVILVKRSYKVTEKYNVPVTVKTEVLAELVGGNAINQWIKDGYPAKK